MKLLALFVLVVVTACNSVTVVPIDDEDAGEEAGAADAGVDG
jgi:hypothetical protein